jgi:hypothetical protein
VRSSFTERALLAALIGAALTVGAALSPRPVQAVPLFAQRYHLLCGACHSVLPELNDFGNAFRNNGYRLEGLPKHGTTVIALREQVGWTEEPSPGTRRFVPVGAILGAQEVGRVEAFFHESLGSEGSPSSLFLGYLAYFDTHSKVLYRAGLYELPLIHSPAQRLDTLTTYGYEGNRVGLNDLTLATTRWGLEAERNVGVARFAATVAFANSAGSLYGGPPVVTGETGSFNGPELGLYGRVPIMPGVQIGVDALKGSRSIAEVAHPVFNDLYTRTGAFVDARYKRIELLAEQYYGHDTNGDGNGNAIDSRGGYARLRYAIGSHAFIGIREDAAATPAATRSLLWYAEAQVGRHARLLFQQVRPIPGGPTSLQGALTFGFPWPWGK